MPQTVEQSKVSNFIALFSSAPTPLFVALATALCWSVSEAVARRNDGDSAVKANGFKVFAVGMVAIPALGFYTLHKQPTSRCAQLTMGAAVLFHFLLVPCFVTFYSPPPAHSRGPRLPGNQVRLFMAGISISHGLRALNMAFNGRSYFEKYGISSFLQCLAHFNVHANLYFFSGKVSQQCDCHSAATEPLDSAPKSRAESGYFSLAHWMHHNLSSDASYECLSLSHFKARRQLHIGSATNQRRLWLVYLLQTALDLSILRIGAVVFANNRQWFERVAAQYSVETGVFGSRIGVFEELNGCYVCFQLQYSCNVFNWFVQLLFGDCNAWIANSQQFSYFAANPRDFWKRQSRHQRAELKACVFRPLLSLFGAKNTGCVALAAFAVFLCNALLHSFISLQTKGRFDLSQWLAAYSLFALPSVAQMLSDRSRFAERLLGHRMAAAFWFLVLHLAMQMAMSVLCPDTFPFGLRSSQHFVHHYY